MGNMENKSDRSQGKISNFSIWDSVVDEKIRALNELESKYRKRGLQIRDLEMELGTLREKWTLFENEKLELIGKVSELNDMNHVLEERNQMLVAHIANMENSTSWKLTKPIRKVLDMVRGKKSE